MLKIHPTDTAKLSQAEAAVVALLWRGLSNGEISRELGKALGTAKSQPSPRLQPSPVLRLTRWLAS